MIGKINIKYSGLTIKQLQWHVGNKNKKIYIYVFFKVQN